METSEAERIERRKTRRRPAIWRATWSGAGGASCTGLIVDVSAGGACFEVDPSQVVPAERSVLALKLTLSNDLTVSLTAVVVHVSERRVGISFTDVATADQIILRHFSEGRPMPE